MAHMERKVIASESLDSISDHLLAALAELRRGVEDTGDGEPPQVGAGERLDPLPRAARALYRQRRLRAFEFDADLFGEPAWGILLDAFIQESAGREVSVSSACIASCVPNTTALRHISLLVSRGLIVRRQSGHDKRLVYISLSERGRSAISAYLARIAKAETDAA